MKLLICSFFIITLPILAQSSEIRDPFSPYNLDDEIDKTVNIVESKKPQDFNSTPLTKEPIFLYNLSGVIKSSSKAIALVKTKNKRDYFVELDDNLGNEGGYITSIRNDAIDVNIDGKTIILKVNSRFEVEDNN